MALETAPIWICFLPQFISVCGDSFGQRCCRVYHKMSRRRFLLAMCMVSCLQMFISLSIIQLAAPKMTTIIYEVKNKTTIDYCDTLEGMGSDDCYPQGPLTIYRAVGACPLLLINGVINMGYYIGEACLYQQPLGVLMLVLAALSSSFIIAPLQEAVGLPGGSGIPVGALILGIAGALICVAERQPKKSDSDDVAAAVDDGAAADGKGETKSLTDGVHVQGFSEQSLDASSAAYHSQVNPITTALDDTRRSKADQQKSKPAIVCGWIKSHLPLLLPFALLATVYAMYFVIMLFYNDHCRSNMWGYNSVDQVLLPLYLLSMFFLIDISPTKIRTTLTTAEDKKETFAQAFRGMLRELTANKCAGLLHMFTYRLLINGRALAYSYIAVRYNLASSYLQLTLIRVVLSWMASVVLVLVLPKFIQAEPFEQVKLKDKVNITLKIIGTVIIVGSLLLLHEKQL